MADRTNPQDIVDEWFLTITARWERALKASPPDFFHTKDMPRLPGDMSLQDFIDAVRSRIGVLPPKDLSGEHMFHGLTRQPEGAR